MSTETQTELPYGARGWRAVKGPHPDNKSGFSATGHRVLLLGDPVEEVTEGGIILQKKTVDATMNLAVWATVVEIGHDCWCDQSTDYCQVGDRVLVGQYAGKFHDSPVDGKTYRFLQDLDVITPLRKVD
jgi:co-chaperonin GroES (HSP10)